MRKFIVNSVVSGLLVMGAVAAHADEVAPCGLKNVGYWSDGHGGSGNVLGCFKDPNTMSGQLGYIRFNGNTCIEATAFTGYRVEGCASPTFYKLTAASSSSSSSKPAASSSSANTGWPQLPPGARILFSGQCSSYGCLDSTQRCSYNQGTYTHAPYPAQDYICYK